MVICDHKMQIRAVNGRFGGKSHDSHVWNLSGERESLRTTYENGNRSERILACTDGWTDSTNFNKDYKTIESAKRTGAPTDAIPTPKAWYFEEMMFIKDQMAIAATDGTETESEECRVSESEEVPTCSSTSKKS
ncbi:uncharacterized protein LOC120781462 isoform X3 [Bactrocera tryoni]|uniref:uncharacterized protein LOC120781462 isoform X3 n=1 Tax=Bactrocera tryoni TaxID=59916 RepID=UPI001A97AC6F|nr:uncharacterized protein LOC120781462 isoform X3 [Bactrocera tryoni]